ncbi:MAG: leucine-rich repeat protein [Clostridiales bacterium]|jgi:uncharacterized repeat protein (TIGR02543 family)|nr:leucine-rich repeat protein [Clostridiales bacterium]
MKKDVGFWFFVVVVAVVFTALVFSYADLNAKVNANDRTASATVTFMSEGAVYGVITADGNAALPADPTRDGYAFAGWYGDYITRFMGFENVASNIIVYAKWNPIYTVTFMLYDGVYKTVTADGNAVLPVAPTRTGYVFEGWSVDSYAFIEFTQADFAGLTSNVKVYAKWTEEQVAEIYTVTFAWGPSKTEAAVVTADGNAVLPAAPTRAGYIFEGWYTDDYFPAEFTQADFAGVAEDIKVYAKWTEEQVAEIYTVTFVWGSSKTETAAVAADADALIPSFVIKDGCIFDGWYTDDFGWYTNDYAPTEFTQADFAGLTRNITVYAKWVESGAQALTYTAVAGGYSVTGIDAGGGILPLTNIIIPDTFNGLPVVEIDNGAFQSNTLILSVTIGNYVTAIGSSAFRGCTSLKAIKVWKYNASYKSIDGVLFDKSGEILRVFTAGKIDTPVYIIPASVKEIYENAFYGSSLYKVIIGDSVTAIGANAFYNCLLQEAEIGASVTSIGSAAFFGSSLRTVVMADGGAIIIGEYAFANCAGLMNITISDSATVIGSGAFYNCASLSSVYIPASVTTIGFYAFRNCASLTDITVGRADGTGMTLGLYWNDGKNVIWQP